MTTEVTPQGTPTVPTQVQPQVDPNVPVQAQPNVQPTPQVQPQAQPVEPVYTPQDYTGNSVLETSLNVFSKSAGVDLGRFDTAIENALKYGDANLIDYASLTAGLKPEQADQAKALAQAVFNETRQQLATQTAEVHRIAGSKEVWDQAAAAFNQQAPEHIKSVVAQMLSNGDLVNAAKFVMEQVNGAGMINNGTPPINGGTGTPAQGISQAEYFAELHKLNKEAGNRSFESGAIGAQLQALQQRRALGKQQGK